MPQKRYKVIFTGRFVKGKDQVKALEMIASMFRVSPEKVRAAFARGPGAVIVSTDNKEQAERYVNGMKKAGAICTVRAQQGDPAHSEKKPAPRPARSTSANARTVEISIGPTDITLTTLTCPRLTGMDKALNLNRKDRATAEFGEIASISLYNAKDGAEDYRFLFFLSTNKRPFGAECTNIAFGDFPGVKGINLLSSLRNFLTFLYARNPGILFEKETFDFVAGGQVPLFTKDEIQLATALYRAMPDEAKTSGISSGYGVAPSPENPEEPEPVRSRGVCPKCGEKREPGSPECPRCGLVFVKWSNAGKGRKRRAIAAASDTGEHGSESLRAFAFRASMAILAGFLLPVPKSSVLFGKTAILWPWNMLGLGLDKAHVAAMANPQSEGAPLYLSLLLIALGVSALAFGQLPKAKIRFWAWHLTGALTLLILLVVFRADGFVLGSIFWPPSIEAGIIWMAALVGAGLLASINHVRKLYDVTLGLRLLQGTGAVLLLVLTSSMLLERPGPWGAWPIIIAELLLISYAAAGVYAAIKKEPTIANFLSLFARGLIILLPLAGAIAQAFVSHDPSDVVIAPGGAALAIFSHIKAALLLFGGTAMFASGLSGLLLLRYGQGQR